MSKSGAKFLASARRLSRRRALLVAGLTAAIGIIVVIKIFAAGSFTAFEPESGTLTSPAAIVTDATASGGHAIKFGAAGSGGCPISTPNVADGPDPWGGCFPGPTTTGVPAGTALTNYTGPCDITTANTVIDSKTVNCGLGIKAANVMIKNSKVLGGVWLDTDIAGSSAWSMTIQDSEVDVGAQQLASVLAGNMTVLRSNIHGGETAVQCEEKSVSCVVQDSYLHGQFLPPDQPWHLGGFLSDGGGNHRLTHNYVVCDHPQNALGEGCSGDINLIPNFATASGIVIENNLLGANVDSAYCTYGGEKSTSPYPHGDHITYRNNIFQRGTNGLCAAYGPVTDFNVNGTGNVWTNNKWTDGTAVDPEN